LQAYFGLVAAGPVECNPDMTKWSQVQRVIALSASLLAIVPIKCNSILAKSAPVEDDYEYVSVLGSNMKKRVKKGTVPTAADSGVQTMNPADLERATQMNNRHVSGVKN
jgi:hypothetical protein